MHPVHAITRWPCKESSDHREEYLRGSQGASSYGMSHLIQGLQQCVHSGADIIDSSGEQKGVCTCPLRSPCPMLVVAWFFVFLPDLSCCCFALFVIVTCSCPIGLCCGLPDFVILCVHGHSTHMGGWPLVHGGRVLRQCDMEWLEFMQASHVRCCSLPWVANTGVTTQTVNPKPQ